MKKQTKQILVGILVSSGMAYGLSNDLLSFSKHFVLSGLICAGATYWFSQKQDKDARVEELEALLGVKKTDERIESLEQMILESDGVISEQEEVIKTYESLLDDASVKFPCNCGNNMFDGIFKPSEEFVVECDYCNNKYAVTLKLETVLLTEPIEELNIDQMIKKNIK